MSFQLPPLAVTVTLLTLSNLFMTFAWYAHLRELGHKPWIVAALVSWGIALFEYLHELRSTAFCTVSTHSGGTPSMPLKAPHTAPSMPAMQSVSRPRLVAPIRPRRTSPSVIRNSAIASAALSTASA